MSYLQLFDGLSPFADNEASLSSRDDHLLHGARLAIGHVVTSGDNVVDKRLGSPESKTQVLKRLKSVQRQNRTCVCKRVRLFSPTGNFYCRNLPYGFWRPGQRNTSFWKTSTVCKHKEKHLN